MDARSALLIAVVGLLALGGCAGPEVAAQSSTASDERRVAIGARSAAVLSDALPKSDDRIAADTAGTVLTSTRTSRGEVLVLGVDLPSGKRCVIHRHADPGLGANSGGRCSAQSAGVPFADHDIDVAGFQELDSRKENAFVIYGAAPAGAERIDLSAGDGRLVSLTTADAGPSYDNRGFFSTPWPSPGTMTVSAFDAGGRLLSTRAVPFGPRE